MLTFGYPYLLLLLLMPLFLRWLLPAHRESRPAVGVPFMDRLSRITGRRPEPGAAVLRKSVYQRIGMIVALTVIVLALARPQYIEDPIVKTIPTRDLLLAVDLSGSMETEDFKDAEERGETGQLSSMYEIAGLMLLQQGKQELALW